MNKKLSKSTIRNLIESLGFDKAFDIIKENDPQSLVLPDMIGTSDAQCTLFQEEPPTQPFKELLAELDEFFDISPADLEPHSPPETMFYLQKKTVSLKKSDSSDQLDNGYSTSEDLATAA